MKTVSETSQRIQGLLGCGPLAVSELIGASKNTLNDNKDLPVTQWESKGYGKKLIALVYVVEKLKIKHPDLPKEGFSFALRQAVRKDPQTKFLKSCLFLIHKGEVENLDYIESIAQEAVEIYYQKKSERCEKESIYTEIFEDVRSSSVMTSML